MFRFTQEPSSGSQIQCLAKITVMVPLCLSIWMLSVLRRHTPPMEIAWRHIRAVGRMGENLKLQRLQNINRCASIVMQQQNPRCWPLDTPSAVCFLLFQCTELNWQSSQLPKILSCKLFVSPKKQSKESCRQTALFWIFSGKEIKCACIPCCRFSSGSKWWIHDSSPVTIFKRNWSPSSR